MNMESIGEYEYSKKDLIGHGAFAVVFKGRRRKKHDFIVAIKCITKKNLAKSQNLLSKEIKILRELSDLKHENVVALLDCKETPHHVYLVMEYCNGGDLADYLQVKTTLSEDTIALFLRQIAGAMQALVAKGIVHRDLKPQNILLTHPGKSPNPPPSEIQIKIADFGFARFLQDGVMAATLCGSPMYMAPEVIMSLQYDAKADLWSVGTIAYQCLTGKAPFQAQTPQQLKQFYERNANLAPNIPPGTSLELRNLLIGLLKRNARERMDFETFFKHPFHNPHAKSSPVPVPRSRSRSSLGESPPVKAVTSSPLSANVYMSPPQTIPSARPKSVIQEPMEVGSPLKEIPKSLPKEAPVLPAKHTPPEDFVMVPDNIPSDHSVSSNSSGQRPPSSVDLNAIFSDASPDSPRHVPKTVRPSPYSRKGTEADCLTPRKSSPPHRAGSISPPIGSPTKGAEGGVVGVSSPSRPSSLPGVQSPQSSPSTEPIPVPGQAKAYEQIQRSTGSFSPGSVSPHHRLHSPASVPRVNSPQGVAIPRRTSAINVGSVSPPQVQFTVGTPPSHATGWSKRNTSQSASNNNSPLRLQNTNRLSNPNVQAAQSGSPLPTILGSPTKIPGGPSFPRLGKPDDSSPTSPLQAAFGKVGMRNRTFTCPDNIQAVGYSPDDNIDPSVKNHNKQMVPVSSATQLGEGRLKREGSTGKLSEQLIRAAFGGQIPSPPTNVFGAQFHTSPSSQGMMVPYSGSNTSLHQVASSSSLRERSDSTSSRNRHVSGSDDVATGNVPPFTQSPPNMEGPIMFVPPDLVEETLMDPEHNETVSKLNFVLALVECIIELAQSRSSPLSESVIDQKPTSTFTLDHIAFISESQRRMEQLVLYVRALQLLSSSISLAKEEIKSARLQPSNTVRNILKEMNDYYHQCLTVCKHLHNKGVGQNLDSDPAAAAVTADKLIYSYAIEMCQTAALDELFGNPQECFRRYRNAQILLHSLAQQAQCETDRQLLNKYKDSVEKRLFQLHSQGYITTTYDSS